MNEYYLMALTFQDSKLETEKKYSLENEKVNNLSKKIEELEELINKQKNDFDEKCLALNTAINSLENSLSETKQKYDFIFSIFICY